MIQDGTKTTGAKAVKKTRVEEITEYLQAQYERECAGDTAWCDLQTASELLDMVRDAEKTIELIRTVDITDGKLVNRMLKTEAQLATETVRADGLRDGLSEALYMLRVLDAEGRLIVDIEDEKPGIQRAYRAWGGKDMSNKVTLTSGQVLVNVHSKDKCAGSPCCIHNPSDHHMIDWPQHWRNDRRIMERICEHGVGHPDPDDITTDTMHGCDGCCVPPKQEQKL